jgi:hypothetical protein
MLFYHNVTYALIFSGGCDIEYYKTSFTIAMVIISTKY